MSQPHGDNSDGDLTFSCLCYQNNKTTSSFWLKRVCVYANESIRISLGRRAIYPYPGAYMSHCSTEGKGVGNYCLLKLHKLFQTRGIKPEYEWLIEHLYIVISDKCNK